eukprot:TRINITY_DN6334_c0_g1_i1.p1 TRINITY_DN6334_c0_g1~~TRINITY_DN6334_c0_g1_i1.p1  ORF type:complete len:479 (-),score=124.96 TRINITY_DN6334_c0_g1_i1:37-1473(-)
MEVPLNEEARLAKEKSKKLLESLENQKKARTLALPTDDNLIKARLRELSDPIVFFGETKAERRERLRKKLVELGEERGMPIIGLNHKPITDEQKTVNHNKEDLQNKLFYFKGREDLGAIRKRIALYSIERSTKRLQREKEKRKKDLEKNSEFGEEDIKTSELFDKIKNITYQTSEIGDIRPLSSCSFDAKGENIANSSWSGDLKIWKVESGKQTHLLRGHVERVQHVKWLPSSELSPSACNLISCGADNVAYLWPLASDSSDMETSDDLTVVSPLGALKGHTDRLNRLGMHPSGNYCGTTSFDCTWRYWDIERREEIFIQEGHAKSVYGISFQCDGSLVGTIGLEGVTRIWDLRTGKTVLTFEDHVKKGLCIDFSPNGYQFATGSADNTIRIYDLRKKKQIYNIPAHHNMISNICYQPLDGKYLVSSSFDKTVKFWSTIDYTPIKTLGGHDGRISYVDVSVNNGVSTVGFDKTIKLAF